MALVINEQPPTVAFARTPILYLVLESNLYQENSFNYIADVYLWQDPDTQPTEPEYSLRKPASIVGGNAIFDIHTLSTDWLITPEFNIGSDPSKTTEMYVNAKVEFRYIYIDTNGDVIELPKGSGVWSDEIQVYNGYNYYMEGLNYKPESHLGIGYPTEYQERVIAAGGTIEAIQCVPLEFLGVTESGFWMSNRPQRQCMPTWTTQWLFCLNDVTSPVRRVYIEITMDDGEILTSVLDLDANTSKVVAVPCGSNNISVDFLGGRTDFVSYKIYGAAVDGTQISRAYTFILDCYITCKYGFKSLQFLNRYGVWDNIITYGSQQDSMEVKRTETLHSPLEVIDNALTMIKPFGQFHMANIHAREMKTLNTGWIAEDWNEVLKQLFLTQYLYDADTLEPYTLDTKSIKFKTSLIDGLHDYSFKLKKAYTVVNTVN